MNLLNQHVSVRKFSDRMVAPELLNSLFVAGARASTTGNMQLYSVVVTRDPVMREQLAPLHFNQPVARTAPVLLTFCADFNRFVKWCEVSGATPGYDNFHSFLTAAIDALLMAQNVCIAAENAGLGICYLGTTTYNAREMIALLKLPRLVVPVTTVALGWPAEQPQQQDRLPVASVIHNEVYHDYSAEEIRAYYSFKEQLESSRKFVEENGKTSLAQVYTDVRYKKADNEFFSGKFLEVLKEQGFLK